MKKQLVTAVLATLVACVSLPALSENAAQSDSNILSPAPKAERTTTYEKYQDNYTAYTAPTADPLSEYSAMEDDSAPMPAEVTYPEAKLPAAGYTEHAQIDDSMPMDEPASKIHSDKPIPSDVITPADQMDSQPMNAAPITEPMNTPTEPLKTAPDMSTPSEDLTAPAPTTEIPPSTTSTQQASIVGIQPFSPAANYMSLAGKLRYDQFASTGEWMTREEAVAAADNQLNAASR